MKTSTIVRRMLPIALESAMHLSSTCKWIIVNLNVRSRRFALLSENCSRNIEHSIDLSVESVIIRFVREQQALPTHSSRLLTVTEIVYCPFPILILCFKTSKIDRQRRPVPRWEPFDIQFQNLQRTHRAEETEQSFRQVPIQQLFWKRLDIEEVNTKTGDCIRRYSFGF